MRVVIIGESPGKMSSPGAPLFPAGNNSAARLAQVLGMSRSEFVSAFDRVNLIPHGPWTTTAAAASAANLSACLLRGRTVVLLGLRVATAFRLGGAPLFEWVEAPWCSRVARLPHPSGRNRWFNAESNVSRVVEFSRRDLVDDVRSQLE